MSAPALRHAYSVVHPGPTRRSSTAVFTVSTGLCRGGQLVGPCGCVTRCLTPIPLGPDGRLLRGFMPAALVDGRRKMWYWSEAPFARVHNKFMHLGTGASPGRSFTCRPRHCGMPTRSCIQAQRVVQAPLFLPFQRAYAGVGSWLALAGA